MSFRGAGPDERVAGATRQRRAALSVRLETELRLARFNHSCQDALGLQAKRCRAVTGPAHRAMPRAPYINPMDQSVLFSCRQAPPFGHAAVSKCARPRRESP